MRRPKGILIPIGGHEDKEGHKSVLARVIKETGKKNPIIEVITIATSLPKETLADYFEVFHSLGIKKVGDLKVENRKHASDRDIIERVRKCDIAFFSGGNQLKLTTMLNGTEFLQVLKERYDEDENFVVAGTSAGASAMANTMILSGSAIDALVKGELQLSNGLDFLNNIFIDTHFSERGRFGRLIQTVTTNPPVLGLGLSEDTAAVIYGGTEMEIVGSGLAVIVDGLEIKYTNLTDVEQGDPITVEGLVMHVLANGKRFSITERRSRHECCSCWSAT